MHIVKVSRRNIVCFSCKKIKRQFEEYELTIPKGSRLYISTDGFIDQNNAKRERFGSKPFQELLTAIQPHIMPQQLEILEGKFRKHQQEEQRDDVTVLGVEL